jgi:hypothetical protein
MRRLPEKVRFVGRHQVDHGHTFRWPPGLKRKSQYAGTNSFEGFEAPLQTALPALTFLAGKV